MKIKVLTVTVGYTKEYKSINPVKISYPLICSRVFHFQKMEEIEERIFQQYISNTTGINILWQFLLINEIK